MAQPILVTQSTSIVQVDTSQVIFGSPAVVLLSSLNAPGGLVTIRDIAGLASTNRGVIISTTSGVHFLDGPSCNIYTINQPYGFLTVTPKTSSIWAVTNTFAFPEGSTAANVNQFTANFATISSLTANQALMSTVGISTLSTDTTQVRYNLSVGQSTITDSAFVKGSLLALSSISTAGGVFAGSNVTTHDIYAGGHIQASCIQVQQSTGYALQVGGAAQFASTISTHRNLDVGGNISTLGNLAVGGNFAINGGLTLTGLAITGGVSTSGTLGVVKDAQFLSSLLVKDDGYFYRSVSVASNLMVNGSISTLNSLAASSIATRGEGLIGTNLSVLSSIYAGGNVAVAGSLAVAGNLVFNDIILDLNALSVFSTLTVGAFISTTGSIAAGGGLRVMGSTILEGLVSTASSMNIGGSLSTTGNLAVGGAVTFLSSLSVRGAVTKLGDVNIGGLLSTQSTLVVGDSIRIASNLFIGGVISSLSSINVAGSLLVAGQTNLSSGLSTLGTAAFFSSVQIQGSVSVMSSMVVRQDLFVQGTLNAAGFSLPGAAAVESIGVQTSTGVSAVFGGSTIQTGLLSTLGGIHMGGQFSTPNTITTGSTLNARFVVATSNISSLGSLGVGGDMSLAGRATLCNLTVTSNLVTTTASSNVFSGCNIFAAAPFFSNGFNGDQTQNYSMGNVIAAGTLQVSQAATFSNQVTAQSNVTTATLTVTGNTLMSNFTSTLGQAAFFSNVAIQGNLSVFSSVNVSCNLNVGGILTAGSFQLPGGAILQTLAVTSNSAFTVNISSSTLHAGLFSTSGAIFSGREISTTSSILVGGIGYFQTGMSSLAQASFASNVQVNGGLVSLSTVTGPVVSASKIHASSIGIGVANSLNQFDMVGTAAIQGSGRSNTLRLTATDQAPGITLSNTTGNYTLFNTKSADVPGAGALAILDNSETYRMVMFPNGNTAIGKASAAAPLDVNGLALADRMGAPLAQFSTLGAATANTSTLNVLSNITITNAGSSGATALEINTSQSSGGLAAIVVKSANNAAILLSNILDGTGITVGTVRFGGQLISNASGGDAILRTESASNKLLFTTGFTNATLALSNGSVGIGTVNPATTLDVVGTVTARTSLATARGTISTLGVSSMTASTISIGTKQRIVVAAGQGTNTLAYSIDGGSTWTAVSSSPFSSYGFSLATNGTVFVAGGAGTNTLAYSFDGITWVGNGSSIFSSSVYNILWDGRQFVAAGSGSAFSLATSPDGITWTGQNPNGSTGGNANGLGYNGFLYVIGYNGGAIFTSTDLVTWTSRTTPFSAGAFGFLWTGSRWVAGGNGVNTLAFSLDGISWTAYGSQPFTTTSGFKFATNGTTIVVAGSGTNTIAYSTDGGVTFTGVNVGFNASFGAYSVIWTGTRFLAGGYGGTTTNLFQSANGITWTSITSPFTTLIYSLEQSSYKTTLQETNFGQLAVDSISTSGSIFAGDTLRVGQSTLVANPLLQNVGINCNAPRFTLDVNGNINAGGNLYVAGTVFQGGGAVGDTLSTSRFLTSSMTTSTLIANTTTVLSNSQTQKVFVASIQRSTGVGVLLRSPDGITWNTVTNPNANFAAFAYSFNGTRWVMGGRVESAANSGSLFTSIDGSNWTQVIQTGFANSYVWDIQWNGQYYLISGVDNTSGSSNTRCITKSTDLTSFTASATAAFTGGTCRQTAWNGNLWVAVGRDAFVLNSSQCIKYSTDGATWTAIPGGGFTNSASAQGFCVIWNGRMFVAGGADSTASVSAAVMKYSYDGIAWYDCQGVVGRRTGVGQINSVAWSGQRFVATCEGARFTNFLIYSDDGITWQNTNGTFTSAGSRVVWNGTRWVATGSDTTAGKVLQTSTDGINWSNSSGNTETSPFTVAVGWSSNVFPDAQIGNMFVYNNQANNFTTSPTSTNTVQQFSNALLLNQLYTDTTGKVGINCNAPQTALGVNGFVTMNKTQDPLTVVLTLNASGSKIRTSMNGGTSWFTATMASTLNFGLSVCWDGRRFLMIAGDGGTPELYTSSNGVNWSRITIVGTFPNDYALRITWTGQQYIVVGSHTSNSSGTICRSTDGVTWTAATSGEFSVAPSRGFDVATDGSLIVAVGQDSVSGASIKYSRDGATWTNATSGAFTAFTSGVTDYGGRGVATNGRIWVAVGLDTTSAASIKWSLDGINWNNSQSGGFSSGGGHVAWNGQYFLAVGKDTTNGVQYSLNGVNWIGVAWPLATYQQTNYVIWTGTEWRIAGYTTTAYVVSATGAIPPVMGTPVTFAGTGAANGIACASNVYPDLQVENLSIYGRNQFPFTQSTNRINLSSSNLTINNVLTIPQNGGNVGIGTSVPEANLHVQGTGGTEFRLATTGAATNFAPAVIQMSNTSNGGCLQIAAGVFTANYGIGAGLGDSVIRTSDTTKKLFLTNGGALVGLCLSNGNVGMGTSNPTYSLHVHKAATSQDVRVMLSDNTTGTGVEDGFQILKGSDQNCALVNYENTSLQFGTNGSVRMTILAGGNVGMGTSNPTYSLHVHKAATSQDVRVMLSDNTTGTGVGDGFQILKGSDQNCALINFENTSLQFGTNGSVRMTILAGGNVGIGTATPGKTLDIVGNFRMSNNNLSMFTQSGVNGASTRDYFTIGSAGAVDNLRYGMLQLVQNADPGDGAAYLSFVRQGNAIVNMGFLSNTNTFLINAGTNMSFSGTNVGIGTLTPGTQLDLSTDGARKLTTNTWTTGSDERIKKNIQKADLDICYSTMKRIPLKYFEWNILNISTHIVTPTDDNHSLGFIAQDVEKVFKNAITKTEEYGYSDFRSLNVDQLFKLHYGTTQKLIDIVEKQSTMLSILEKDIAALKASLSTV